MALNLSKSYTPTSNQVANSSSYNTDIAALFNAFSGLEAQTSTLGALTITPTANGSKFVVTNAAAATIFSVNTTTPIVSVGSGTDFRIEATQKLYLDGGSDTYISEIAANQIGFIAGGTQRSRITASLFETSVNIAPDAANTLTCGTASAYWSEVNTKELTKRGGGGFGCYDEGVELQDGGIVSDTEAILNLKPHPTKKNSYGKPIIDMTTLPKDVFVKGIDDIEDSDGEAIFPMISILIGAVKELTERIKVLEGEGAK